MNRLQSPLFLSGITFLVFGTFVGSMAISIVEIEQTIGGSHARFGLLFAGALAVGGITAALIGVRAHKRGAGSTMREALLIWGLLVLLAASVQSPLFFALFFILAFGAAGAVDVVMNTIAAEELKGDSGGMLRIHSLFNLGAAIGAAIAGFVIVNGWDWRITWYGEGAAAFLLATINWKRMNVAVDQEEHVPLSAALRILKREHLLLLVAAFAISAVVEGGLESWGPLYLRLNLDSGVARGAVATAAGYLIAFSCRFGLSFFGDKWGAKRCALVGTSVAFAGIVLLVTSDSPVLGSLGLAMGVGGISTNWPLLMAYATKGSANSALITGGLSSTGYAGLVASPAVLGVVAAAFTLRTSISILAVSAVVVLLALSTMRSEKSTVSRR